MTFLKPTAGDRVAPYIQDVEFMSTLVEMALAFRSGKLSPDEKRNAANTGSIKVNNDTDDAIPFGELRQLKDLQDNVNESADMMRLISNNPVWTVEAPVWHTKIDRLVVVHQPIMPQSLGNARGPRIVAVPITNTPGADDRWVMVDPSTPTRLKSCKTSGIYKMLGWYDMTVFSPPFYGSGQDNIAVIDTYISQPWWHYELTEASNAPSTTAAKLLDLEDTEFSSSISLSDPHGYMDDQASGGKGTCIHIDNKFYAIQAVC